MTRRKNPTPAALAKKAPPRLDAAALLDSYAAEAWPRALGLAQAAGDAHARCPRRACRVAGRCQQAEAGDTLACPAGVADEVLSRAAFAAAFHAAEEMAAMQGDFAAPAAQDGDSLHTAWPTIAPGGTRRPRPAASRA